MDESIEKKQSSKEKSYIVNIKNHYGDKSGGYKSKLEYGMYGPTKS